MPSRRAHNQMGLLKSIVHSQNSSSQSPPSLNNSVETGSQQSENDVVFVIGDVEVTYNELQDLTQSSPRAKKHSSLPSDTQLSVKYGRTTSRRRPPVPRARHANSTTGTGSDISDDVRRDSRPSDKRHHRHRHHCCRHDNYVEKHTDENLELKYKELQLLLNQQFLEHKNELLETQVKHSQEMMKNYIAYSKGNTPSPTWAEENLKQRGKRIKRPSSAHSALSPQLRASGDVPRDVPCNGMEASLKYANEAWENMSDSPQSNTYEELDSSMSSSKRVSFIEAEGSIDNDSQDQSTESTMNATEKEIALKSILKEKQDKKKTVIRQGHRKFKLPADNKNARTSLISTTEKVEPMHIKLFNKGHQTDSDVLDNKTAHTENNWESSDNSQIRDWLKEKKLLERRSRLERRDKLREKRDFARANAEYRRRRMSENEHAVDDWMKQKEKQIKVLRKREHLRKKEDAMKQKANGSNLNSPMQNDAKAKSDLSTKIDQKEKRKIPLSEVDNEIKKQERLTAKLNIQGETRSKNRPSSSRPASISPRHHESKVRPQSARVNKPNTEVADSDKTDSNKTKLSYDKWLAEKNKQALEDKKKKVDQEKESLSKSDPELEKLIPNLARKRIDKIKQGKTKIDTGLNSVDESANASFGGMQLVNEDDDAGKPQAKQKQRFTWKLPPKDLDKLSGPSPKPPNSRPQSSKRRPASAKPSFRPPTPPHPSKSPIPNQRSRADNVSDSQYNPFHTPIPPEVLRLSDNAKNKAAADRRKHYSRQIWESVSGERPEPQGCDHPEKKSPRQHTPPGDVRESIAKTFDNTSNQTSNESCERNSKTPSPTIQSSVDEDIVSVSDISNSSDKQKSKTFLTSIE